ncbi:L-aspartate oxidase [Clostridia bacterium]|nr:L-aspartate oxidase [Clostridia bacterium]
MTSYDVIIVGTGAAGLFCALNLPECLSVAMLCKEGLCDNDSFLAQGGISTLRTPDDYEPFYEDTMKAGHFENDPDAVSEMINASTRIIKDLLDAGVDFEKTDKGFSYTREGAHSHNRIMYHGDSTGKEITSKLLETAKTRRNIQMFPYMSMIDIIHKANACNGVVVSDKSGFHALFSKAVVWATGGVGGLFRNSTNFEHLTGDAVVLSLIHNIKLRDVSYIQIHPTTLYTPKEGRKFLISESLRGEGAILLDLRGNRFVNELLPRDVLSLKIAEQMKSDNSEYIYLSAEKIDKNELLRHFPYICKHCEEQGFDLTKVPIPVAPAQHYFMGGVLADLQGQTSMRNLYAVGETACNGVHGKNRLASNSLLEALVFAKNAAHRLSAKLENFEKTEVDLSVYGGDFLKKHRHLFTSQINPNEALFL